MKNNNAVLVQNDVIPAILNSKSVLSTKKASKAKQVLFAFISFATCLLLISAIVLLYIYPSDNDIKGTFYFGVGEKEGLFCRNGSANLPHANWTGLAALKVMDPSRTLKTPADLCELMSAGGFDIKSPATLNVYNYTVANGWGRIRHNLMLLCYQQTATYSIVSLVKLTSDTLGVSSFKTGTESGTKSAVYGQARNFYYTTSAETVMSKVTKVMQSQHSIGDSDLRGIAIHGAVAAMSFMTPPTFYEGNRAFVDPGVAVKTFSNRNMNIPSIFYEVFTSLIPVEITLGSLAKKIYGGTYQVKYYHTSSLIWKNTKLWELDTNYWCDMVLFGDGNADKGSHCKSLQYVRHRRELVGNMKSTAMSTAVNWKSEGTQYHKTLWQEITALQMVIASYGIGEGILITIGKKQKSILFDEFYEMSRFGYDRWAVNFERNSYVDAKTEDAQCVYGVNFYDMEMTAENNAIGLYFQFLLLILFSLYCARSNGVSYMKWCHWYRCFLSSTFTTSVLGFQVMYMHVAFSQYTSAAGTHPAVLVRSTALRILEHILYPLFLEKFAFGAITHIDLRNLLGLVSLVNGILTISSTVYWISTTLPLRMSYWGSLLPLFYNHELYAAQAAEVTFAVADSSSDLCSTYVCVDTSLVRTWGFVSIIIPYAAIVLIYLILKGKVRGKQTTTTSFEANCTGVSIAYLLGEGDIEYDRTQGYSAVSMELVWLMAYIQIGSILVRRRDIIVVWSVEFLPIKVLNGRMISMSTWLINEKGVVDKSCHIFPGEGLTLLRNKMRSKLKLSKLY